jgi:hypothetical protein
MSPEAGRSRASATAPDRVAPDVWAPAAEAVERLSWAEALSIEDSANRHAVSATTARIAVASAPHAFGEEIAGR